MRRFATVTTLCLALGAPSAALADGGALLSGYGGPGSGDQSTLGSKLLPAPKSTASGAAGLRATPTPTHVAAPATTTTTTATHTTPQHTRTTPLKHHLTPLKHATPTATTKTPAATVGPTATAAPPVALPSNLYPREETNAGTTIFGAPAGDVWPLLFGLLVLVAVAVVTRRAVIPESPDLPARTA